MDNLEAANDDGPGELAGLREEFRGFRIWREITGDRVRYVARSQFPGLNPHTVVTADAAELRAALEPAREAALVPFSTTTASIARIYDYLLGGKDNYARTELPPGGSWRHSPRLGRSPTPIGRSRPRPSGTPRGRASASSST